MTAGSESLTRVLHTLRLRGFADSENVGSVIHMPATEVEMMLRELAESDPAFVRHRAGESLRGWNLTSHGREEGERLLAVELDRAGCRSEIIAAYRQFLAINGTFLSVCTRWQLKNETTINDHSDAVYDAAVIAELHHLHSLVCPIVSGLAARLARFADYEVRLGRALQRVIDHDLDWFARPMIDSYHTVWFELHEDLLATLGLDRTSETTT